MKTFPLLFVMLLLAMIATAQQPPVNCANYPYNVANISGYPAPKCTLLTPLVCNYAAAVHTDSVNFNAGHVYVPYCTQFGLNPLADGRMALCFGRNVPNNTMSTFLTSPRGQVLVFELNLAQTPDMVHVWTYKNGVTTPIASMPAMTGLFDLFNGYARLFEFNFNSGDPGYPGDPNKNRMQFAVDRDERLNVIYDVVNNLWDGNTKAKVWITSVAGVLPINSQVATLFPNTCPTSIPLLKQQGGGLDDGNLSGIEVFPNPSREGSIHLRTGHAGRYRLVSVMGTVVAEGQAEAGATRIATGSLSQGVYLLEFSSDGRREHRRVVIE